MIVYLPQITNGQTLISNEEIYTHTHKIPLKISNLKPQIKCFNKKFFFFNTLSTDTNYFITFLQDVIVTNFLLFLI